MASSVPLTATGSSGSQTTANDASLQASVPANDVSGGTPSSIQPGTSSDALVSKVGIPLTQTPLSTVNLGATAAQTSVATHQSTHKTNPVLLGLCGLLLVVALASFWAMNRAAKNTTDY